MDLKEIQSLLASFDASKATRLRVQDGEFSLELQKDGVPPTPAGGGAPFSASEENVPLVCVPMSVPVPEKGSAVTAPLPGTYYAAPEEGAAPFVAVGDRIEAGQTVALIEAMKIFNEVPAPVGGKVIEVLAKDGEVVGYGEVLLRIETDV